MLVCSYWVESVTEAEFIPFLKDEDTEVKKTSEHAQGIRCCFSQAGCQSTFFRNIRYRLPFLKQHYKHLWIFLYSILYPNHKPEHISLALLSSHFFKTAFNWIICNWSYSAFHSQDIKSLSSYQLFWLFFKAYSLMVCCHTIYFPTEENPHMLNLLTDWLMLGFPRHQKYVRECMY